ncbi:MAG: PorP/SprF family type IX secretion system membrane protein [Bacteroidota bacterium]
MTAKRHILLLIVIVLISGKLFSQDIHFTQFYNSPLTLNPALTGNIDGNIRAALNHRNQWNSISVPFVTSSFSLDAKLMEDRLKGDAVGAGIEIMNDKTGEGHLSNLQIMISSSYHKYFGAEKNHMVALGIQAGFFQRKIDFSKLSFASQYVDGDFNTNISSGENTLNYTTGNFDINTGIFYQAEKTNNYNINGGFAVYHLTRPNESLLGEIAKVPLRYVFHMEAIYVLNDKTKIRPDILYMTQNKAKAFTFEGRAEHTFKTIKDQPANIIFGAGCRISDAIILITGFKYEKWDVCFSYDINISKLHPASNYRGGFEISIIFSGRVLHGKNKLPESVPCIRL